MTWQQIYNFLGITDFINFISNPAIQEALFWPKAVFISFAIFFLVAVIYFYFNSTYIQYQFLQDVWEFFSWQAYGMRDVNKRWNKIIKRTESGLENDYKLALMEADDFLQQALEGAGYEGENFEELIGNASAKVQDYEEILKAHNVRNFIVYDPNYKLDLSQAKKMILHYEKVIKSLSISF